MDCKFKFHHVEQVHQIGGPSSLLTTTHCRKMMTDEYAQLAIMGALEAKGQATWFSTVCPFALTGTFEECPEHQG